MVINCLLEVKELFDDNDISVFPLYGTLLGFIRDGGIIDGDDDADVGAWYTEYDKIRNLEPILNKKGYVLLGSGMKYRNRIINIYPNDGNNVFHIGIIFFIRDRNNVIQMIMPDNNFIERLGKRWNIEKTFLFKLANRVYRYLLLRKILTNVYQGEWFDNFREIEIYGTIFNVFSKSDEYLVSKYGKAWQIKDNSWTRAKAVSLNKNYKKYKIQDKEVKKYWVNRAL